MKKTTLIAMCIFCTSLSFGQNLPKTDSTTFYRHKSDSLSRAYKNLIKLDNLRKASAIHDCKIVQHNPTQAKFIVGWISRDLK